MLTTTLRQLENYEYSYLWKELRAKLGAAYAKDTPLPLEQVLKISTSLHFALWALLTVDGHRNAMRLYACNCTKYSLNFFEQAHPHDERPRRFIETMERAAHGQATDKELSAAWTIARESAWAAADVASAAMAMRVSSKIGLLLRMADSNSITDGMAASRIDVEMSADEAKVARKPWDVTCDPANNVALDVARAASDAATWNAEYIAASAADANADADAYCTWLSAWSKARRTFGREFVRLCGLEDEYMEVDMKKENH